MTELRPRTHSLASCYENSFTIILRLSSLPQHSGANSRDFRTSIRAALKAAMEQAKALGSSSEAIQLSFFALVALLDESVLKMQRPAFADWAQRPLQEEMFGHNRAGEVFFEHLRALLARPDSQETADCLEVYCLCMLLGFKGKYALSAGISHLSGQEGTGAWSASHSGGDIGTLIRLCREKIDRIRHPMGFLPQEALPDVKKAETVDRWSRGLGIAALILLVLSVLAWGGFWFALNSAT